MKKTLMTLAALAVASVAQAAFSEGITIGSLQYTNGFFAEGASSMTGYGLTTNPTRATGYTFSFTVTNLIAEDTMVAAYWSDSYGWGGSRVFVIDGGSMTLNTTLGSLATTKTGDGSAEALNKFDEYTYTVDHHRATFVDDNNNAITLQAGKTYTVTFDSETLKEGSTDLYNQKILLKEGDTVLGSAVYVGNMEGSNSWSNSMYLSSVPEPTTATLSLLALAGLAARRRRK